MDGLSSNPTLTVYDILHLPIYISEWNWYYISSAISMKEVRRNPNLSWDKQGLSLNPTLTVDDILHMSIEDQMWNIHAISNRVPIIDVYTHPDLKWSRDELSRNKDIRISDLVAWQELPSSIYKRWQYPTDVVII